MTYVYCTVIQLPDQTMTEDRRQTQFPDLLLSMARKRGCRFASSIPNLGNRIPVGDDPPSLASLWLSQIQRRETKQGPAIAGVRFWFGHDPDMDLHLAALVPDNRQLLIRIDDGLISGPDQWTRSRLDTFLDLCAFVFVRMEGEYGYGLIHDSRYPYPWYDLAKGIQAIYDYNFLGPDLVQRMGLELVRCIPARRQRELEGGGLLLEMTTNPLLETSDNYERAAAFLKIPDIRRLGD